MGLMESASNLSEIANDIYFRCDPVHTINIKKAFELVPDLTKIETLYNAIKSVGNGVNLDASKYSLNQTDTIYVSIKEFNNGIPMIFDKDGDFLDSITFLNDDVLTEDESVSRGIISSNEILIARTGATIGKAVWFGDVLESNPELKFIASGFTTRVNVNENNYAKFINLWLNLPFVRPFIVAKSAGKCQRNVSQEYIYSIPFPNINKDKQTEIADKHYPIITDFEKGILSLPTISEIIDEILEDELDIDLSFSNNKGLLYAEDNLVNLSQRISLRCDAKQNQHYFRKISEVLSSIETIKLGDMLSQAFIKGGQPSYLQDDESDGIPVISTLSIQNLNINTDACRIISFEDFEEMSDDIKPKSGDILVTLDGVVSVGKPVFFDLIDDFAIDSHIGIIRLDQEFDAEITAYLLSSKVCQAQFRLFESGASSKSINEIDLRNILIPKLSDTQIKNLKERIISKKTENYNTINQLRMQRDKLYSELIDDIKKYL